ncbi:response regulator [Rhodoferax mekongensis]|uniref:Response regulator n=1 Tax=Rhodoferax mekongensis TaxID=3068341 RepID=A0ABZ0B0U3_9BURK|nr:MULTISPECIES: response regulator [unclassified Rhodoferax]MDT7514664.1 response regulator [Rhodoferax sp. TBRC 17199]WNO04547.1 response regulator [Rhodoferax sp. TBRC 17307]
MKKTILSVEDGVGLRRLIRMTLEYMGFHVLEAADGEEGLSMVREHRPDLVLMDVRMPGISGLTASAVMRSDPELSSIPIVMLTAAGATSDIAAGMASGAKAYLVKPFQPVELIEVVTRLIEEADPAFAALPGIEY